MISDLNGTLGSRQFLNVANERTCFASCASTFKSVINVLLMTLQSNKNCRLLLLISSSQLLELHVFTFYLKFTNLTTQADLSSLRLVTLQNLFPAIQTKLWHLSLDLYRHTLKTVNTRFKFFAISISWAKANLFSLWILHLFTPSSLIAKVFQPSNIFLIYAQLRNQARKHCSAWLNCVNTKLFFIR